MKPLIEFFQFLKSPFEEKILNPSFKIRLKYFWQAFLLNLIVSGLVSFILLALKSKEIINIDQSRLEFILNYMPFWLFLFLASVLIPLIEETIFRLPLTRKFNPLYFIIKVYFQIKNDKEKDDKYLIQEIWQKVFKSFFFISALTFSIVHLTNYDLTSNLVYFSLLLIFPFFFAGLIIGFLRIRFNFITGFLFHFFHNLTFILISLVVLNSPTKKIERETSGYLIEIFESGSLFYNEYRTSFNCVEDKCKYIDSVNFTKVPLIEAVSIITNKSESLIYCNFKKELSKINLYYFNKHKDTTNLKSDSKIILNHLENAFNLKIYKKNNLKNIVYVQEDSLDLNSPTNVSGKNDSNKRKLVKRVWLDRMTLKNATINDLCEALNKEYDKYFTTKNKALKKYDFKISRNMSSDEVMKALSDKYGLSFLHQKRNMEIVQIKKSTSP